MGNETREPTLLTTTTEDEKAPKTMLSVVRWRISDYES